MTSATNTKLSIKQLQVAFGISHMTAYQWRQGTTTKDPLPVAPLTKAEAAMPRPPITFAVKSVRAWAKKHGVEFAVDPDKLLAQGSSPAKSGPKVKASVKVAKEVVAKAKVAVKKAKETAKVIPIRSITVKKSKPARQPEAAAAVSP